MQDLLPRRRYPDVAASGMDPLSTMKITDGRRTAIPMRTSTPTYYLNQNADVAAARLVDPLLRCEQSRLERGSWCKHRLQARASLSNANPDVVAANVDPLCRLRSASGRRRGAWRSSLDAAALWAGEQIPWSMTGLLLRQHADVAAAGVDTVRPTTDGSGWREGRAIRMPCSTPPTMNQILT